VSLVYLPNGRIPTVLDRLRERYIEDAMGVEEFERAVEEALRDGTADTTEGFPLIGGLG
jgi:20S proteasome alpha/beta subunit